MIAPWAGILIVLAALGAMIAGLRAWQVRRAPPAETVRKALHIGMGFVTLTFPWLFSSPWPVWVLAALAAISLIVLRYTTRIHHGLDRVIQEVGRKSLGDIYFPISIAVLFTLARGNPLLYVIPVLILTFGDAAAALIGVRLGRTRYRSADSVKTAEGSLAMFATSAIFTFVPLAVIGGVWLPHALMMALMIGAVAMIFEAIALEGRDNLYLPIAAFVLLGIYLNLSLAQVAARLLVLALLLAMMIARRGRTTMDDGAVLGAVLIGYFSWAVGGWVWLIPPLASVFAYTRIYPNPYADGTRAHTVHAVIASCAGALCWIVIKAAWPERDFTAVFVLAWTAQLAIIGLAAICFAFPRRGMPAKVLASGACAWAVIFVPCVVLGGSAIDMPQKVAASVAAAIVPAALFPLLQPGMDNCPKDTARWIRQGVLGFMGSLFGLFINW